jgi:hypothetical protein
MRVLGPLIALSTPRFGLFEISAMVVAGKVRFNFSFNKFMQHQNRIHVQGRVGQRQHWERAESQTRLEGRKLLREGYKQLLDSQLVPNAVADLPYLGQVAQ